jgi:two-component system LytT family sensor kinase
MRGEMKDILGALLLLAALGVSAFAATRVARGRLRLIAPEREAKRDALHAASAMVPHLRSGLNRETAHQAAPHLRALTDAAVLAIAIPGEVLAIDGPGGPSLAREALLALVERVSDGGVHVEHRPGLDLPDLPAVVAALVVQDTFIGALISLYGPDYRVRPDDARVLQEAAALVCAQLELSTLAGQDERLAEAELRALRNRISPHFVYNSLAAIASYITSSPEDARRLLTEFADFIRYAFRGERSYVTLADELHNVEKYLSLEQARFGDRLAVRVTVAPEVLQVAVPVLSLQPLVENAVRHGMESARGHVRVEIVGLDQNYSVELRVSDNGVGMTAEEAAAALSGATGGVGVHNVDRRLRATFGDDYGLRIISQPGRGTTVVMSVPRYRAGVRPT